METTQYRKEYYNKNKDHILQKMYRKVHCDVCNVEVSFCNLKKHQATKRHKSNAKEHDHLTDEEIELLLIDEFKKFMKDSDVCMKLIRQQ